MNTKFSITDVFESWSKLGEGLYGSCFKALYRNEYYAVKISKPLAPVFDVKKSTSKNINFFRRLKDPNWTKTFHFEFQIHNDSYKSIQVMEYDPTFIVDAKTFHQRKEIVSKYITSSNLDYWDIHEENILFSKDNYKIIDIPVTCEKGYDLLKYLYFPNSNHSNNFITNRILNHKLDTNARHSQYKEKITNRNFIIK